MKCAPSPPTSGNWRRISHQYRKGPHEGLSADLTMRHLHPFFWSTLVLLSLAIGPLISAHGEQQRSQTGDTLFQEYCRDCHGSQGYGRGGLSPFLDQEPANLFSQFTQSKTDQELFSIIKNGGGVDMHGWADTFTDQQIGSLVQFIRSLP